MATTKKATRKVTRSTKAERAKKSTAMTRVKPTPHTGSIFGMTRYARMELYNTLVARADDNEQQLVLLGSAVSEEESATDSFDAADYLPAMVGVCYASNAVIYDAEKVIAISATYEGMTEEESREWHEFNTFGFRGTPTASGPVYPIFMWPTEVL